MREFKVGDKVIRINSGAGTFVSIGEVGEITKIDKSDDLYYMKGYGHSPENIELAWNPEAGEMIEVTLNLGGSWFEKEFFAMDGDRYVFRSAGDPNRFTSCVHARQIKKTHTITLEDGTKVELSEESYKALQDSVK